MGVAHELWQIKNFASDLLILKLALAETAEKLCSIADEDQECVMQYVLLYTSCILISAWSIPNQLIFVTG